MSKFVYRVLLRGPADTTTLAQTQTPGQRLHPSSPICPSIHLNPPPLPPHIHVDAPGSKWGEEKRRGKHEDSQNIAFDTCPYLWHIGLQPSLEKWNCPIFRNKIMRPLLSWKGTHFVLYIREIKMFSCSVTNELTAHSHTRITMQNPALLIGRGTVACKKIPEDKRLGQLGKQTNMANTYSHCWWYVFHHEQ